VSHPNQMGLNYIRKMLPEASKTLFTREEKAYRKFAANQLNMLQVRDNVLGVRPTPPGMVIHHPRFFDPPMSCRDGRHQYVTDMLMSIPILKCKKCGRIVMKGSYEGTETRREIRERHVPRSTPLDPGFEVFET